MMLVLVIGGPTAAAVDDPEPIDPEPAGPLGPDREMLRDIVNETDVEQTVAWVYGLIAEVTSELEGLLCIHDSTWIPEAAIDQYLGGGAVIGQDPEGHAVIVNYATGWEDGTGWRYLLLAIQAGSNCDEAYFGEYHAGTATVPPR